MLTITITEGKSEFYLNLGKGYETGFFNNIINYSLAMIYYKLDVKHGNSNVFI